VCVCVCRCRHIKQPAATVTDAAAIRQRAADNDPVVPSNAASAAVVDDNNPSQPSVRRRSARPSATEQGSPSPTGDAGRCLPPSSASLRLRKATVSVDDDDDDDDDDDGMLAVVLLVGCHCLYCFQVEGFAFV